MRQSLRQLCFVLMVALSLNLLMPVSVWAQGAGVGIKGGLLFSKLDFGGDNAGTEELLDNRAGWLAGLFFGGNRRGPVGVQGEILYGRKGGEIANSPLDIHVLEIPVLLRLNAGSSSLSGVSVYGLAGPAFDIRLKSSLADIDIADNTESFDVNLVLGAGVEITRFIIEGRYIRGLRNISKDLTVSDDIKTTAWALLVGLRFN